MRIRLSHLCSGLLQQQYSPKQHAMISRNPPIPPPAASPAFPVQEIVNTIRLYNTILLINHHSFTILNCTSLAKIQENTRHIVKLVISFNKHV